MTSNSEQLMAEVTALSKRLRMPYLQAVAADMLPTAKAQRRDPAEVVRVLLIERPKVATVNGHLELPTDGQVISPLADTKAPR